MTVMLSAHFTLAELLASDTAQQQGIDNTPDDQVLIELTRTALMLEAVRRVLGNKPIIVSSGYRCPELNKAVGGASNSQHMYGQAADFTCPDFGSPEDVIRAIYAAGKIPFDQMIYEFASWVHISQAGIGNEPRMQVLNIDEHGTTALA